LLEKESTGRFLQASSLFGLSEGLALDLKLVEHLPKGVIAVQRRGEADDVSSRRQTHSAQAKKERKG
jgi:hypothetical protein